MIAQTADDYEIYLFKFDCSIKCVNRSNLFVNQTFCIML